MVAPEHPVIETHPENPFPDLRLDVPFPSLQNYAKEIDLDAMDHQQHSHTPYLVLLMKAIAKWREEDGRDESSFPEKYAEKKEIKEILKRMRKPDEKGRDDEENFQEAINAVNTAVLRSQIPPETRDLLAEAEKKDLNRRPDNAEFWTLCKALRRFIDYTGFLPLRGSLPDMTADTERYIQVQNIFHKKAAEDAKEMSRLAEEVAKSYGRPPPGQEAVHKFCRNAGFLRLISLYDEYSTEGSRVDVIRKAMEEGDQLMSWYLVYRATERFCSEKGRYPGTNGIPVELDDKDLRNRVRVLGKEMRMEGLVEKAVTDDMVTEMCRYGAAELHPMASLLGGIAAHEVVKVITGQYVPLNNTFVFDGNSDNGATFEL